MAQSHQHAAGLVFRLLNDQVTAVIPSSTPPSWQYHNRDQRRSLNVIALISGGKDSFYTILHCLNNGHKIVALANLHPLLADTANSAGEQEDLNSHMYQTVGHKIIPHYANALGIPLYRRPITGKQVQRATTYSPPDSDLRDSEETESLVPLLEAVKKHHPNSDAVCSGAILSDYQRTRVESVALRLGLTPLAYLWKYPVLPPGNDPNSLLRDMAAAGLDARIIRIASADLSESLLTKRLTDSSTIAAMDRAISRYPSESSGAGLGEGGEYETLVVDGPDSLFSATLEVQWPERKDFVTEGWGNVWVDVQNVKTIPKRHIDVSSEATVKIPDLLDMRFFEVLNVIQSVRHVENVESNYNDKTVMPMTRNLWELNSMTGSKSQVVAKETHPAIQDEMEDILEQVEVQLKQRHAQKADILFTVILLRSLDNFKAVNEVYGKFFSAPNPPARATLAVGKDCPPGINIVLQYTFMTTPEFGPKKALHVQSRSYWAPANIARYSQATAISLSMRNPEIKTVYVAGQIPLNPATMEQASATHERQTKNTESHGNNTWRSNFSFQAALSLQHLWRIGMEMDVSWWTGAVAYLSSDEQAPQLKAKLAGKAWNFLHKMEIATDSEDEDGESDAYDKLQQSRRSFVAGGNLKNLPDWSVIKAEGRSDVENYVEQNELQAQSLCNVEEVTASYAPPFFAAEVEELPMKSAVEWHAFSGLTGGPIVINFNHEKSLGTLYEWSVHPHEIYVTLFMPWKSSPTKMPYDAIKALRSLSSWTDFDIAHHLAPDRLDSEGFYGSYASYVDFKDKGFSGASGYGGVIPCRSLHDEHGRRLAAVLMFRWTGEGLPTRNK